MTTSRSRIIGVMFILAVAVVLDMHDRLTSVQNNEGVTSTGQSSLGSALPKPLSLVQKCQHLYDNGHSWEWRECMGVGRK